MVSQIVIALKLALYERILRYLNLKIMIFQSFKRIAVVLCLLFYLSCCGSHKSKESNIKIQVSNFIKTIKFQGKGETCYSVTIDIINNTDSAFCFWTMSCSWESNWVFDNSSYTFFVDCSSNFPIISLINPHQRIIYNGIIELVDTMSIITSNELKVGFVVVKKNEVSEGSDFIEILRNKISTKKDIIWSEPFKIPE
jgi:hypothetical protein